MKLKRPYLFELEDLSWFPSNIRDGMTDYLKYFLTATDFYRPVIPLLAEIIEKTGTSTIVDVCSGSGGPIVDLHSEVSRRLSRPITLILTDKFPNLEAYRLAKQKTDGVINYIETSVSAENVPSQLKGLRTLFSAFHHFGPNMAKSIIADAVNKQNSIAIFDGGDRNIMTMLGIIVFHPIAFLFVTPFLKPFRFNRVLFTYIIPIIPICTVWDGVVSILRLYSPEKMLKLACEVESNMYLWKAGKVRNRYGMNVAYLIGTPR